MTLAEGVTCDGCGADLRAAPIPEKDRSWYPPNVTHFTRVIGIQYGYTNPDHYDGVSEWRCPDCGRREGRWSGRVLADGESEPRFGGRA